MKTETRFTMKQTIKELEDKVAELEKRIAALEQRPVYVPVYQPPAPVDFGPHMPWTLPQPSWVSPPYRHLDITCQNHYPHTQ